KMEIKERFMAHFWPSLEGGTISPVIDSVYPIQEAEAAHAVMTASQHIGKIVLKVR
ncbi:MAG: zinc-binding dehydrogenase, partial [Caldilineaceae bacterium]|nr:zinc-binding dehydrogenase [Caldilineaceae bacterium]